MWKVYAQNFFKKVLIRDCKFWSGRKEGGKECLATGVTWTRNKCLKARKTSEQRPLISPRYLQEGWTQRAGEVKAENAMGTILEGFNALMPAWGTWTRMSPQCHEVLGSERTTTDWEAQSLWGHSSVRSGIGKSALIGIDGKEIPSLEKTWWRTSEDLLVLKKNIVSHFKNHDRHQKKPIAGIKK